MKIKGENKNRDKFDSHTFIIHFIADLIRHLWILCVLMSNIYIYIYIYVYIIYIHIYTLY